MEKLYPVVALVGPSGSGKTRLLYEAVAREPKIVGVVKGYTNRKPRTGGLDAITDPILYEFVAGDEIEKLQRAADMFNCASYGENRYGTTRGQVESVTKDKLGIVALVEQGVINFRNAGYTVIVIKIVPKDKGVDEAPRGEVARARDDKAREESGLIPDYAIENSWQTGGFEKALTELTDILAMIYETS